MTAIRRRRPWDLPSNSITPERCFLDRRTFLKAAGSIGAALALGGCGDSGAEEPGRPKGPAGELYPAKKAEGFALDRALTMEKSATTHNNFYEFGLSKNIWKEAEKLTTEPWTLDCGGLVKTPKVWDLAELMRDIGLEERACRFRCVEAWSMAVPWTGFPLQKLIAKLDPLGSAKFVRFVSFHRPAEAPGQKDDAYPWPYYEGLTIEEATNDLALVATGAYGKPLAKSQGAPVRIIVPWKYGYKSPKSVAKIELVEARPKTFWNDLVPAEYGFESNVDPAVPHPRWSQATERFIGADGSIEKKDTVKFNGYGEQVAALYR